MTPGTGYWDVFTLVNGRHTGLLSINKNNIDHFFQLEDPSAASNTNAMYVERIKVAGPGDADSPQSHISFASPGGDGNIPIGVSSMNPSNGEKVVFAGDYSIWDIDEKKGNKFNIYVHGAANTTQLGVVNGTGGVTVVVVFPDTDAFNTAITDFSFQMVQ